MLPENEVIFDEGLKSNSFFFSPAEEIRVRVRALIHGHVADMMANLLDNVELENIVEEVHEKAIFGRMKRQFVQRDVMDMMKPLIIDAVNSYKRK